MSQKKVLVVLFEVPEEVAIYILPEDAPELPKLRELAAAGVHGNAYDLVTLFYGYDPTPEPSAMMKYRIEESKTSVFTSQTRGDFSEVITLAFLL